MICAVVFCDLPYALLRNHRFIATRADVLSQVRPALNAVSRAFLAGPDPRLTPLPGLRGQTFLARFDLRLTLFPARS